MRLFEVSKTMFKLYLGTNVVMAQRRMLERKMAKKALSTESTKHVLREFQKDGKDHYLIVFSIFLELS